MSAILHDVLNCYDDDYSNLVTDDIKDFINIHLKFYANLRCKDIVFLFFNTKDEEIVNSNIKELESTLYTSVVSVHLPNSCNCLCFVDRMYEYYKEQNFEVVKEEIESLNSWYLKISWEKHILRKLGGQIL